MKPKLRFKEFNGNEFPKWKDEKLGKFLIKYNEITTENNQYPPLTSSRKGIFLQKDYFNNRQIASKDNTGYNIVPFGYFTYRHMSDDTVFYFNINNLVEYGIVSTLYPVFTTTDKMNSIFLKYFLNESILFKKYCILQKQGGSRTYMYFNKLKEFVIKMPCLEEQTKIADFLSTVDEKIQNQQDKITHLENIKKGFMQKIFSRKIRFKDANGNEFPEWEEEIFGKVVNIIMGQSPNSNSYNEDKIGVPLVQGNADIKNRITSPTRYTNKPTKICKKDSLIMTVRAPVGYIGKANQEVCIGRGVCEVQVKKCNSDYIYQFLLSKEDSWDKISQGSTFTSISSNDIKNLRIELPYLEEQQKIADFLSLFDDKIDAEKETLNHLKELKKGLLQQMFV